MGRGKKANVMSVKVDGKDLTVDSKQKRGADRMEKLAEIFSQNRIAAILKMNFKQAKELFSQPDMSWAAFCDHKIAAWEKQKETPPQRKRKPLTPEQIEKKRKRFEQLKLELAEVEGILAAAAWTVTRNG